jgi:hypothetical protein
MNTRHMKRRSPTGGAFGLLERIVQIARAILTECQCNRMHPAEHVLIFAMLAKTIGSARSARLLIAARRYWDAKLIVRSMYDSLVDVLYILHDPRETPKLMRLFRIEMACDEHERISFAARILGKHVPDLCRSRPVCRRIESEYAWAKQQPELSPGHGELARRWKNIRRGEKIKAIRARYGGWLDNLDFTVASMGDAAAHSRGLALQSFMRLGDEPGRYRFNTAGGLPLNLDRATVLILEPFACLHAMCGSIVDAFYLGKTHEKRLQAVQGAWTTMASARPTSRRAKARR